MEKLKSTDLAHFLAAGIKVKFGRGQDEFIGDLTGCDNSFITLENVQGRYASRAEYHVWNEEAFWPVLRHMDDMSVEEFEKVEAFDKLCGIVTREAHRIRWYCERGIDCFGWIGEGLAIRAKMTAQQFEKKATTIGLKKGFFKDFQFVESMDARICCLLKTEKAIMLARNCNIEIEESPGGYLIYFLA